MKRQRHREILEIISQESVETQEDLARRLRERGFEVTQATVSRDIKELRLLKVLTDEGSYRYAVAEKAEQGLTERLRRIFTETALHVDVAENLIVIKTLPGSAHAAAEMVDTMRWPETVGTLAGDNTILVIARDAQIAPALAERFRGMMK
ncbi:MAG: arginine repressor [Christensenellales bacterium]|uniref:Arginine repressor n=1 Tax=Candidatus Avichristensenella intestinipullorum TaxID=2840693 RepID=A0A9D0YXT5_9FIRM|nr:arginine repressor [Christensenellales bacterium]HIQ63361.1 arginine repressor [Candidatus Avichristensenella intestinipullorum]